MADDAPGWPHGAAADDGVHVTLRVVGPEGRCTRFGNPHRQFGDGADLFNLGRPLLNLPVIPVERKTVYGNQVYLIPSDKYMTIAEGRLHLTRKEQKHGPHLTIDVFFNTSYSIS